MARPLRFLFRENALVEVTTRTFQGRLLLRPSRELNDLFVGVLGRALERHPGVRLHAVAHLSNHYHLLLTVPNGGLLARFMCFVNGNLAREASRVHGWMEKFWGRRYRAIEVLNEEASLNRLRYLLAHGVKEGLVARCVDWPGVNSLHFLLRGEPLRGTWYNRTLAYDAERRGLKPPADELAKPYEVELAPLPAWADLPEPQRRRRVADMVSDIEAEAAGRREGEPAGASVVLAADPQRRPSRVARRPAPRCHTTSSDLRDRFTEAYRAFVEAFRETAHRFAVHKSSWRLPRGCFPPALGYAPPFDPPPLAPTTTPSLPRPRGAPREMALVVA